MTKTSITAFGQKPFLVMGIVNVTPDSFYDGGLTANIHSAYDRAMRMVEDGATIIDIGGESSRPGAEPVSLDEELARTIPLIERLHTALDIPISIDTVKSGVAQAAIAAGATIVNDISGGRHDADIARVVATSGCMVVVMHSRKKPVDMQENPLYTKCVDEVLEELFLSIKTFLSAGVQPAQIVIDPGIGFAKRVEDNLVLLNSVDRFVALGFEVLVGVSRKSCIGAITGSAVAMRLAGSLGAIAIPFLAGARIFRVHDVRETVDFLTTLHAVRGA